MATLGVISDTHGLLRPEARSAMAGVDRIIHAGDIDDRQTLQWLTTMAEVTAVRGNCDRGTWAKALPECAVVTVEGFSIYVVHDLERMTVDPKAEGIAVVICGHSHRPRNETRDGILYLNPGSAGPRRFDCPISMAKLQVGPEGISAQIVILGNPS